MTDTLDYIGEQLKALTSIPSPTGFTRAVTDYVMKTLKEMGFTPDARQKATCLCAWVARASLLCLQAMWTRLEPWPVPSRTMAACARRLLADISGPRQMAKTAPFTRATGSRLHGCGPEYRAFFSRCRRKSQRRSRRTWRSCLTRTLTPRTMCGLGYPDRRHHRYGSSYRDHQERLHQESLFGR